MKTTSLFSSFHKQLIAAGKLFARNWKPAILIALLPITPLLFIIPFLIESNTVIQEEWFTRQADISLISIVIGTLAVFATFLSLYYVRCSLFILFSHKKGGRNALKEGARRFIPFLWTELLIVAIVGILTLPALLFRWWYADFGAFSLATARGELQANLLAYITLIILLLPAIIVSMWFVFGPISTALSKAPGGVDALRHSMRIVHGSWWNIFLRIFGITLIAFLIRIIFTPLPFASWVVSFIVSLLLAAFLVVLYREGQKKVT